MTNAVLETLARLVADLDSLDVGWALVGGLAVSTRVEPRFTRDVDVVVAARSDGDAEQIIGTWETVGGASTYVPSEFARDGEQAIDTLTRLAISIVSVNSAFETLGVTLYEASLAGGDLASGLIDTMGGMEKFQTAISGYYENYYSGTEKLSNAVEPSSTASTATVPGRTGSVSR